MVKNKLMKEKIKKILKIIIILLIVIASIIIIKNEIIYKTGGYDESIYDEGCNVAGIELHGDLVPYIYESQTEEGTTAISDQTASQDIVSAIEQADSDDDIKAIILEIDSMGGTPVAAEEVANALKRTNKPTVVLIRESGLSSAYWAATGADRIFASENSDIGSIGITISYLDYSKANQKDGITYNQLSSGKFKDAGASDKPLTAEEKALFMRDIKILKDNFVKNVADNRKISIEEVEKMADGSSILGEMALEKGLIDEIGDLNSVLSYLNNKIGEPAQICW